MRRFLKHMWDWLINCPLFQRDYHLWVSRVGSGLFECLICQKTRFEPDEVRDMAALEVDQQPNPEILREYLEGDINWDPIVTHLAQTPPDRVSYAMDPRLLETNDQDDALMVGGTE
jgi:hypothetical protein